MKPVKFIGFMAIILFAAVRMFSGCSDEETPTDPGDGNGGETTLWYVDADATGTGDGKSWANAFTHPSPAMNAATAGDQIWVAEGSYAPTSADPAVPVLQFKPDVAVFGGFEGSETNVDEADPENNATYLVGNSDVYHVVVGADSAMLNGFTISGGEADGDDATARDH